MVRGAARCSGVAACLAACAPEPVPDACDDPDVVQAFLCADDARLELGTGETAFTEVDDGGTVWLIKGPQGLQHVYVAARFDVDPDALVVERAMATMTVWRAADGAELLAETSFGVGLFVEGTTATVPGMRWVVEAPDAVVDTEVVVGLVVAPVGYGVAPRGVLDAVVQWSPDTPP